MPRDKPAKPFEWGCSQSVFTEDEIDLLDRYGRIFQQLASGEREPRNEAQERFIACTRGQAEPRSDYEKAWRKYQLRIETESDPANRSMFGETPCEHDDPQDWKAMSGKQWGDMMKRTRGKD
jgi:uncharacterized protein YifE (UPF0438 family)